MTFRSKFLHLRHAFLLAALFLTLTLAGWSDIAVPAAGPVVSPTNAPATDAKPQQDNAVNQQSDEAPVDLPVFKPISIHAERDADIGREVGELLEQGHYLQKPISPEISQRWLSNYFLALDPTHLFFLQSDIDEFTAKYRNNLGDLLLNGDSNAAIDPAFEIFNRYMQRVQEDVNLAEKVLHEKFDFTKDEAFTIRTIKSPWIKDETASEAIWHGQVKSDMLNGLLAKKSQEDMIKDLSKRYVSFLRDGEEDDDMDVLEAYLNALTQAYDPHSDYMDPEESQDFNIMAINHAVKGIGAVLRPDGGYATIEEVIPGGPADLDKRLQAGDRILAVGQGTDKPVDAVYMKLKHVITMIRGPKGSMVHLVVHPASAKDEAAQEDIILKRDEVSIKDSLASANIIEHPLPGGGIEKLGVIDLHDFYDNTSPDVAKLIQRLKKENVAGIILDFRNNGGGLLDQAVDLTGLFVKQEPVVQIRRSDNHIDQLGPEDTRPIYDGPLLVMVNKMSASATEIVAAALQDYGRAIIVGDPSTHGKGTVQTLIPLDQQMPIGFPADPGAGDLKMTVQKFYRVAGGSTQQKGVVPDIILPSLLDAYDSVLGETSLPYYLPYDTVPAVSFNYLNLTVPYLTALRANSVTRVAASSDFNYVRQDVAFVKKKVEDSTVSLNEATRLKEQADLKAQEAQRKKNLLARKSSRDKVLDLTLDMVDQNLPAAPPNEKKPKIDTADSDADDGTGLDSAINNPTDDPQLDEAVNIMSDYTRMLRDSGSTLVQASPVSASK